MSDAVIIHAGTPRPPGTKSLAEAGKGLGLTGTFAAPHAQPETIALLVRTVDELRMRLLFLEREQQRCWWHGARDAYRRWRLQA